MTAVSLLYEAEIELWEAVIHYDEKATGLGFDFAAEVKASLERLKENPWAERVCH
jgi:hypothetical protein